MTSAQVVQGTREVLRDAIPKIAVAQTTREVLRNTTPDFTLTQIAREVLHSVHPGFPLCLKTDMAELWFDPGVFLDFSDPATRAKFHDIANHAISLGLDGELPTGLNPLLYLTLPNADLDPYDFAHNATGNGALQVITNDGRGVGYGPAPTKPGG